MMGRQSDGQKPLFHSFSLDELQEPTRPFRNGDGKR